MKTKLTAAMIVLSGLTTLSFGVSKLVQAESLPVEMPSPDANRLNYGLKASALGHGWFVIAGQNADFSVQNGCNIINTGFYTENGKVWIINTGTSRIYGEQQRQLITQRTHGARFQEVVNLNLHPDYFLGNQAYKEEKIIATSTTRAGMQREAEAYETNLYKLCGDWMKQTKAVFPNGTIKPPTELQWGSLKLETLELKGHTDSDLVLFDRKHGVMFSGGLVFHNRIITVPHAHVKAWIASLKTLKTLNPKIIVPSHGPVAFGTGAIDQTLDYLTWLDHHFTQSAEMGLDENEVMREGVPKRFQTFAAYPEEFYRNVTTLYPRYVKTVMGDFK